MGKTTTMSNREILKLHEGLIALDGIASKDGSVVRFEFDDNISWNLAKARAIVERAIEVHQRERNKLKAKYGVVDKMALTAENAPKVATFIEKNDVLLDQTNELTGILRFKRSDLQKHGNKIPPGVLMQLMPLIDE